MSHYCTVTVHKSQAVSASDELGGEYSAPAELADKNGRVCFGFDTDDTPDAITALMLDIGFVGFGHFMPEVGDSGPDLGQVFAVTSDKAVDFAGAVEGPYVYMPENGIPHAADLAEARRYWAVRKIAEALMDEMEEE